MVAPRIAAFEAAIRAKSLPVIPSNTSLPFQISFAVEYIEVGEMPTSCEKIESCRMLQADMMVSRFVASAKLRAFGSNSGNGNERITSQLPPV
jgi:hypothetical protein